MDTSIERQLAVRFCQMMRETLTPEELAEAVRRNKTAKYDGCCGTHDFTDSNQVMIDAAVDIGVADADSCDMSEETTRIWNAAWTMARDSEFTLN